MMQKKKLRLLLAGLAASTILFAAPLSVSVDASSAGSDNSQGDPADADAGPNYDLGKITKSVNLTSDCPEGCVHIITQSEDKAKHTIAVISGNHEVHFSNSGSKNIAIDGDDKAPPFEIKDGKVDLYLDAGCTATLDNRNRPSGAGLQVKSPGKLAIYGAGTLKAYGADYSAGIGENSGPVGDILISGDVTVKAYGGAAAAGIGSGYEGTCGAITINNNATVNAIGGDCKRYDVNGTVGEMREGGPGIGQTRGTPSLGANITISGGTVGAIGGKKSKPANSLTSGFLCHNLVSSNGSGNIFTNDTSLGGVNGQKNLNAIVWKALVEREIGNTRDTSGDVWGKASIGEDLSNTMLYLRSGSSLTITKNPTNFTNCGIAVSDDGGDVRTNAIYNRDFLKGSPITPDGIALYVGISDKAVDVTEAIEYTGEDVKEDVVHVKDSVPKSDSPYETESYLVDKDSWDLFIKRSQAPEYALYDKEKNPIRECGTYKLRYRHKKDNYSGDNEDEKYDGDPVDLSKEVTVNRADISKCTFGVKPLTYTGKELNPELTVTFNNKVMEKPELDFTVEWDKDYNAGKHKAIIGLTSASNFTISTGTKKEIEYTIERASLGDIAQMTVTPPENEYRGTKQEPVVAVTLKDTGKTLKPDEDYQLIYSGGDSTNFTNAGDITCTATGLEGGNYKGELTEGYKITPKEISIKTDKITAEPKDYDGNGEVILKGVAFDGLADVDEGKVKLKSKGIVDANNEGHAGEYETIHFEGAIELEYEDADGNKTPCTNYTVKYDGGEIRLKEKAVINKVTPTLGEGERKLTHKDPYEVNVNGITFDCTVQIERQKGVKYEFKMDGDPEAEDGWIKEINPEDKSMAYAVFRGIGAAVSPEDKHIFYVRSEGSNDVEQVVLDSHEVIFEKLPNPKTPPKPTISYNEGGNPDKKTYTVTMDRLEDNDIEYRIIVPGKEEDGEFGSYGEPYSIESLGDPGTTYVGQVRYKETEVYKASDPVSSEEIKTPPSPLANSGPKYKYTWKRIIPNQSDNIEVPPGLQDVDYTKMDEITADLTRYLSQLGAYQDKDHTAFYDVKIQVITRNEAGKTETREALPGDFEDGGIPVTLPAKNLPSGVVATENQFSAVHMFESNEYAEYSAGDVEICADSEGADVFKGTGKGVTFIVNGASPIGIAWSEAPDEPDNPLDPDDPNNPNNPDDPNNPGGDDNNNQGDGNNNQGDGTGTNNDGTDPNNARATDGTGNGTDQNGTGTNGDGTNAEGKESQSITDALKSAVAALAPKTGDTNSIIMWVVIAVAACAAVIVAIRSKAKNGKKAKASAANKTSASTAKKSTASTAKKSTATTAKKPTATTAKKPTSATVKKTTSTTKKSNTGSAKKTTTKK